MSEFSCCICLDNLDTNTQPLCLCKKCGNVMHIRCTQKLSVQICPLCNHGEYYGSGWFIKLPEDTFIPHCIRNFKAVIEKRLTLKEAITMAAKYTELFIKYEKMQIMRQESKNYLDEANKIIAEKSKAKYNEYFDAFNTDWEQEVKSLLSNYKDKQFQQEITDKKHELLNQQSKSLYDWEQRLVEREAQIQKREADLKEMEDKMFIASYINKKTIEYHQEKQQQYQDYVTAQQQMLKDRRKTINKHTIALTRIESELFQTTKNYIEMLENEFNKLTAIMNETKSNIEKELKYRLENIDIQQRKTKHNNKRSFILEQTLREAIENSKGLVEKYTQVMLDEITAEEKEVAKKFIIESQIEKDKIISGAKQEAKVIVNQAITKRDDIMLQLDTEKALFQSEKERIETMTKTFDNLKQLLT